MTFQVYVSFLVPKVNFSSENTDGHSVWKKQSPPEQPRRKLLDGRLSRGSDKTHDRPSPTQDRASPTLQSKGHAKSKSDGRASPLVDSKRCQNPMDGRTSPLVDNKKQNKNVKEHLGRKKSTGSPRLPDKDTLLKLSSTCSSNDGIMSPTSEKAEGNLDRHLSRSQEILTVEEDRLSDTDNEDDDDDEVLKTPTHGDLVLTGMERVTII